MVGMPTGTFRLLKNPLTAPRRETSGSSAPSLGHRTGLPPAGLAGPPSLLLSSAGGEDWRPRGCLFGRLLLLPWSVWSSRPALLFPCTCPKDSACQRGASILSLCTCSFDRENVPIETQMCSLMGPALHSLLWLVYIITCHPDSPV